MNDRMNKFKLVEGTARQDKASAREGIQGRQDDDNAVVFISHTWCSWVSLEKEMAPFLTRWKLLSFHLMPSQRPRPSDLGLQIPFKLYLSCQLGDWLVFYSMRPILY